jgi:hypothetical protein
MAILRASDFMVGRSALPTTERNSTAEPMGLMMGRRALKPSGINLRTSKSSFTVPPQASWDEPLYGRPF